MQENNIEREEESNKIFQILESINSKKQKFLQIIDQLSDECLNKNPEISSENLAQINDLFAYALDQIKQKINLYPNRNDESNQTNIELIVEKLNVLKQMVPPEGNMGKQSKKNQLKPDQIDQNQYFSEGPFYRWTRRNQRKKKGQADKDCKEVQTLLEQKLEYKKYFQTVNSKNMIKPHYKCKLCQGNFFLQNGLQCFNHWKSKHCHTIYKCQEHNQNFTSIYDYFIHNFIYHNPNRHIQHEDVICQFCNKKLKRRKFYAAHLLNLHYDQIEQELKEFQKKNED